MFTIKVIDKYGDPAYYKKVSVRNIKRKQD